MESHWKLELNEEAQQQNVTPSKDVNLAQRNSATPSLKIDPSIVYGYFEEYLNSPRPEASTSSRQDFPSQNATITSQDVESIQQNHLQVQEHKQCDQESLLSQLSEQNLYECGQLSHTPHVFPSPTCYLPYAQSMFLDNLSEDNSPMQSVTPPPILSSSQQNTQKPNTSPYRKLCCEEGCTNQARTLGRCKRHGGSKRCTNPGCVNIVQSRGLCIRHGGGSRCQERGCTRAAQTNRRCKLHGGGRPCTMVGCEKRAHFKRLCRQHGGGIKCCIDGCEKWAQRERMCLKHVRALQPVDT